LKKLIKECIKKIVYKTGITTYRNSNKNGEKRQKNLPPIFDEPFAALAYEQVGRRVAFKCPIDLTIKLNALSYGSDGWHPFVETLKEYERGKTTTYVGSLLETFYMKHQPTNASESIIGFQQAPDSFKNHLPHIYRLSPWRPGNAEDVDKSIRRFTKKDSIKYTGREMTLESDGFQYHGPVSLDKGRLEYFRLIKTFESIKHKGYNRALGHAHFLTLRRGNEIRYLAIGNGNHRIAAMAALGYDTIPAIFQRPSIIDLDMAEYWPQVQKKVWSQNQAIAYFNHLFYFESGDWARKSGMSF